MMVVTAHAGQVYQMHLPDIIGHSAKEGVAIFFVLSGFVIAFVADTKEPDWRSFARARATRMLSVVPLAVAVMLVCYAVGTAIDPAVYRQVGPAANVGAIGGPPTAWAVLRYVTFTNEVWFDRAVISTGAPFWSLAFEAAYYAGFAVLSYAKGWRRWVLAVVWMLACGPRILLAMPLWLTGVAAWAIVKRVKGQGRPLIGGFVLLVLGAAAVLWRRWSGADAMPLFEWGHVNALAASMTYYVVLCLLVATGVVVVAICAPAASVLPTSAEKGVRFCAGASFTIYIAHLPVMVLIAAAWADASSALWAATAATAATLAMMFLLAEAGERRKHAFAKTFSNGT